MNPSRIVVLLIVPIIIIVILRQQSFVISDFNLPSIAASVVLHDYIQTKICFLRPSDYNNYLLLSLGP